MSEMLKTRYFFVGIVFSSTYGPTQTCVWTPAVVVFHEIDFEKNQYIYTFDSHRCMRRFKYQIAIRDKMSTHE